MIAEGAQQVRHRRSFTLGSATGPWPSRSADAVAAAGPRRRLRRPEGRGRPGDGSAPPGSGEAGVRRVSAYAGTPARLADLCQSIPRDLANVWISGISISGGG